MDTVLYELANVGLTLLLVAICVIIITWVGEQL